MRRSRFTLVIALTLLVLAPLGATQGTPPVPDDAAEAQVGPATVYAWVAGANVTAGTNGTLDLALDLHENGTYNATWTVTGDGNVEVLDVGGFETGNLTVTNATGDTPEYASSLSFHVPEGSTGTASFTVNVTLHEAQERNGTGNGTTNTTTVWAEVGSGTLNPTVDIVQPPTPPAGPDEDPNWLLIGAVGAVVAASAVGGYALYKRRQEPLAPRRSRALQELEAEQERKPDARAEAMEEAREAQEQAQQSREVQILEAKAEDHQRGIDLARKRLDQGEITEHQFQRIKERKEEALERVLDDIESLRDS